MGALKAYLPSHKERKICCGSVTLVCGVILSKLDCDVCDGVIFIRLNCNICHNASMYPWCNIFTCRGGLNNDAGSNAALTEGTRSIEPGLRPMVIGTKAPY